MGKSQVGIHVAGVLTLGKGLPERGCRTQREPRADSILSISSFKSSNDLRAQGRRFESSFFQSFPIVSSSVHAIQFAGPF